MKIELVTRLENALAAIEGKLQTVQSTVDAEAQKDEQLVRRAEDLLQKAEAVLGNG